MEGTWENSEKGLIALVDGNLFLTIASQKVNAGVAWEISYANSSIDVGAGQFGNRFIPYIFSENKLTLVFKKDAEGIKDSIIFSRSSRTPDSFNQKTVLEGDWKWSTASLASTDAQELNKMTGFQRVRFRGSWMIFPNSSKRENAYLVKIDDKQIKYPDSSRLIASYQFSGDSLVLTFPDGSEKGTKIIYTKG
jgi:hypothetical protein